MYPEDDARIVQHLHSSLLNYSPNKQLSRKENMMSMQLLVYF